MRARKHMHHEQAADEIAFAEVYNLAATRRGATAFSVMPFLCKRYRPIASTA